MELSNDKRHSILIVDDESSNIEQLNEALQDEYRILFATNGEDALKIAESQYPDLILLDIMMPGMGGHEVCKRLKATPTLYNIPIFFVTAMTDIAEETAGLEMGADDYLSKPINPSLVKVRVRNRLNIKRAEKIIIQAYENLKHSEARTRAILENALDAIITIEQDGGILEFNPAAEELFGYSAAEAVEKKLSEMINQYELLDANIEDLAFQAKQKQSTPLIKHRIKLPGKRADGNVVNLEIGLTAILQKGQLTYTCFIKDITDYKQLLTSLRETLAAAESSNKAKSEFLANMSHEIRSPMNAIMGMTELVLATKLNDNQLENLEIVQNSANNLMTLINDILDFSKADAGQLYLENIPFDLRGRIEINCNNLAILAHKKELELYYDIAPDIPPLIGDPLRLSQILTNLVNNAFKFTHEGEVAILVEKKEDAKCTEKQICLHFSVRDTGIGIPPDRTATIFEQFTQVDASTTRKYGGTGLGLTISKRLVELMDGEIWVESEENKGSIFHFTAKFGIGKRTDSIPQKGSIKREGQQYKPTHLRGIRILIADNKKTGRAITKEIISRYGADLQEAADSPSVLKSLRKAKADGQPIDIVLIDHDLSFTADENLEVAALTDDKIIMMLPTNMSYPQSAPGYHAEYDNSMKKPIKLYSLLKRIDILLGRRTVAQKKQIDSILTTGPTTPPLHILLVDDLPTNQKLACDILGQAGHKIVVANNGYEAIRKLAGETFDLVLMDLHMPEMDGYEATKRIREGNDKNSWDINIPIIAVTARAMQSEAKRCLDAGMNTYLSKPYRAMELLEIIEPYAKKPSPKYMIKKPKKEPPILVKVNSDEETIRSLSKSFITEGSQHLTNLQHALKDKRAVQTLKEIDWIRTTATGIGANRVKISTIQLKGKVEMKQWKESLHIFDSLEHEFQKAVEAIEKADDKSE
ncbi:MAG: response regulator [Magnetococcales bacterium]|nr:response regulator [Magnetococcales bacterium]